MDFTSEAEVHAYFWPDWFERGWYLSLSQAAKARVLLADLRRQVARLKKEAPLKTPRPKRRKAT